MKKKRATKYKDNTGITDNLSRCIQADNVRPNAEEKYSMVVENAPDGIAIIQDKVIKFANKSQAEMSGYIVEELIGRSILELIPTDFVSVINENFL